MSYIVSKVIFKREITISHATRV